jgi:hypothetical protein
MTGRPTDFEQFQARQKAWADRAAMLKAAAESAAKAGSERKRKPGRRRKLNPLAAAVERRLRPPAPEPPPPPIDSFEGDETNRRIAIGKCHGVASFVYFVKSGDGEAVKVGRAVDPYVRLSDLQIANHRRLELIGVIPGGDKEERRLHSLLSRHHISGEWFALNDEVARTVATELARVTDADLYIRAPNSLAARVAEMRQREAARAAERSQEPA